jgi:hypothetical protein
MCVGKPTDFMQDWVRGLVAAFLELFWGFFLFALEWPKIIRRSGLFRELRARTAADLKTSRTFKG